MIVMSGEGNVMAHLTDLYDSRTCIKTPNVELIMTCKLILEYPFWLLLTLLFHFIRLRYDYIGIDNYSGALGVDTIVNRLTLVSHTSKQ